MKFIPHLLFASMALIFAAHAAAAEPGELSVQTEAGLTWNDNVYRSPARAYIDYGQSSQPLVTPEVRQGVYIPLSLDAAYTQPVTGNQRLLASLEFRAQHYLDTELDNANRQNYLITLGDTLSLAEGKAHQFTLSVFHGAYHNTYVDRDTGLEKETSSGSNVSDRYQYNKTGARARWQRNGKLFDFKMHGTWQQRDYADPQVISQLDNTYYKAKGSGYLHPNKSNRFGMHYSYYVYDYQERPARDAGGTLSSANPVLTYRYQKLSGDFRHKLNKAWKFTAGLDYTVRTDNFRGYGNYEEIEGDIAVRYRIKKGVKAKLRLNRWMRDYPNAFAYDNIAMRSPKNANGSEAKFSLAYALPGRDSIEFMLSSNNIRGTDARYEYQQRIASCVYVWNL